MTATVPGDMPTPGRPRVVARVEPETEERLDRLARALSTAFLEATRSDALRVVIDLGLAEAERLAKAGKLRSKPEPQDERKGRKAGGEP